MRWTEIALLAAFLSGVPGCGDKGEISVASSTDSRAYGRGELIAAVEAFANSDRSPASYHKLATTVESLQPKFNESVRKEAERHLVVLALAPLEAHITDSPEVRLDKLGTTVWPTVIHEVPTPGETPQAYAERACAGSLALKCKHVVPEYRALELSAVVWDRLEERVRDAIRECEDCRTQPHYREIQDKYARYERTVTDAAAAQRTKSKPSRWPMAGEHARPWSGAPLLEVTDSGAHTLEGVAIEPGDWTPVLTAARHDHEVLGVFLKSSARVADLRTILAEANKAGFAQVALQVRVRQYPFPLAEYRLQTSPGQQSVRVKDIDTIQILVQGLDAIAATGQRQHRI